MSKIFKIIFLCLITLTVGILFYTINNDILVFKVHWNRAKKEVQSKVFYNKNFKLFYQKNGKWLSDQKELVQSDDKLEVIKYLVSGWLNLLHEEQITSKKIALVEVLVDSSGGDIYLSFDRNLLNKHDSVFNKSMVIHGLLKTLQNADLGIQNVYFLVNNSPMIDWQLDFSKAWPAFGYMPI